MAIPRITVCKSESFFFFLGPLLKNPLNVHSVLSLDSHHTFSWSGANTRNAPGRLR
jgi:hypothetical protein